MRVLILTIELPYLTGGGGGNLRQYHLIRELSRCHEIWLVTAALPGEMERVREVERYCRRLEVVPHRLRFAPPRRRWHYWLNRLRYLASGLPFEVGRFEHLLPDFRLRVERLLQDGAPDILDVEQSNVAHWGSLVPERVPRVLVLHNVLSEVARLKVGLGGPWRERLVDRLEYAKTLRYESRHFAAYDLLVAVSEADGRSAKSLTPRSHLSVVPNGVDTGYFSPEGNEGGRDLLFVGSMGHGPNEDGVLYFCREIYPRIRAARPGVGFQVVGRLPSRRVLDLNGRDGIVVIGEVPDVRPYLRAAAVVVVPLRYGGGTRLKILEALAAGKAVVSTSAGADGLESADGRELLLADEPESFARAVVGLLEDPGRRAPLGRRGRALVESRYDWGALAVRMEQAFARARDARSEKSGRVP